MWCVYPPLPSQPVAEFTPGDTENWFLYYPPFNTAHQNYAGAYAVRPLEFSDNNQPIELTVRSLHDRLHGIAVQISGVAPTRQVMVSLGENYSVAITSKNRDWSETGPNGYNDIAGPGLDSIYYGSFPVGVAELRKGENVIERRVFQWPMGETFIFLGFADSLLLAYVSWGYRAGYEGGTAPAPAQFGSSTLSFETSADVADVVAGRSTVKLTRLDGDGNAIFSVLSAAYTQDPLVLADDGFYLPERTDAKVARNLDRIGSLRSRCLNLTVGTKADGRGSGMAVVDAAGEHEVTASSMGFFSFFLPWVRWPGTIPGQPDDGKIWAPATKCSNCGFTAAQNVLLENLMIKCYFMSRTSTSYDDPRNGIPKELSFDITASAGAFAHNEYKGGIIPEPYPGGAPGIPYNMPYDYDFNKDEFISLFFGGFTRARAWVQMFASEGVATYDAATVEAAGPKIEMEVRVFVALTNRVLSYLSGGTASPFDIYPIEYRKTLTESEMNDFFDGGTIVFEPPAWLLNVPPIHKIEITAG